MLNWIKELAVYGSSTNEIDAEDFHLGFELALPHEMQEFLAENNASKKAVEKENSFLDEHELALG